MEQRQGALEDLGLMAANPDPDFWRGKRVLITGHTGFKGSWLSLWLQRMGAELCGFALAPPTQPALFDVARVGDGMRSEIGDIRDFETVAAVVSSFQPQIVLHLAAQPLVRYSYDAPIETYATNVMGTIHLLEAVRRAGSVKAVVNVTSDKCYENREWLWGYREDEAMGGYDPYSNSKGCSELVTAAYRQSFMAKEGIATGSGRAGNVIGGGDWALDRLIPDILRAHERGETIVVRSPKSIRPWQHVLEPLSGYLLLAERLFADGEAFAEGWNLGPNDEDAMPVAWIVERMVGMLDHAPGWRIDAPPTQHEANYLKLDASKARARLDWQPRWPLAAALQKIVDWHRAQLAGDDMHDVTLRQIADYETSFELRKAS